MTKLIKNNVVRLPKVTTSVERALKNANDKAKSHRWRKVVVIGEGPHGYLITNSKMKYYELIGFIEFAKNIIIDETTIDD